MKVIDESFRQSIFYIITVQAAGGQLMTVSGICAGGDPHDVYQTVRACVQESMETDQFIVLFYSALPTNKTRDS